LAAFRSAAQQAGFCTPVFDGAGLTNRAVVGRLASRAFESTRHLARPRVCVVGVGFKPGSDSLRDSQAVHLVQSLLVRGALVTVFDPRAEVNARREFGENVCYAESFDEAVGSADVAILLDPGLIEGQLPNHGKVVLDALGRRLGAASANCEGFYGRS
jgi:UDP-glucose 6-dehydrogenase